MGSYLFLYNHCNVVIVIEFHSYEKTVGLYLFYLTTVMLYWLSCSTRMRRLGLHLFYINIIML
jgi:hypothetical protein